MAISSYIIITSSSVEELTQECGKLCGEGWTPVGGVAYNNNKDLYHQALVRFDNQPVGKTEAEGGNEDVAVEPTIIGWEWKPAEWEEEFWTVVKNEFSKEALLFVSVNSIRSVKKLLSEIKRPSFEEEAGDKIFKELTKIIEKYHWKDKG